MYPRGFCDNCKDRNKNLYQLVIMVEEGKCYFSGRLYDWEGIQNAVKEMRELYEKHGVTHNVGYREV